jgi:hypothetical protein
MEVKTEKTLTQPSATADATHPASVLEELVRNWIDWRDKQHTTDPCIHLSRQRQRQAYQPQSC